MDDPTVVSRTPGLHLYRRRFWPYKLLEEGDTLYWYHPLCRALLWKTEVEQCEAFEFGSKQSLRRVLRREMGNSPGWPEAAIVRGPEHGFCLAYRVRPLRRVFVPRPSDVHFSRFGWTDERPDGMESWLAAADDPYYQLPMRRRAGGGARVGVARRAHDGEGER